MNSTATVHADLEAVAAEEVDGGDCSYRGCPDPADFRVRVEQTTGDASTVIRVCRHCSRTNAIHAADLLANGVSVDE